MSNINNQNEVKDQNESTDELRAHNFFVINQSIANSFVPKMEIPQSIHRVYNFDKNALGRGVIAIVSAFDYPTALADLMFLVSNLDCQWKLALTH